MSKPFRFRHVHESAGVFVLATVAAAIAGVAITGHSQHWFQPTRTLTIILPEEGSLGLRPGAEVFILGVSVGSVDDIAPDPDGRMRAEVIIRKDYSQFLHTDSAAVVRKTFGIAGDAYVDITRGSGAPLPAKGAVIQSSSDRVPTEMLTDMIVQLRDETVPTLKQARSAMAEYQKFAVDLRDPQGHLQQTLARADKISQSLERGDGVAGKLLTDPEMGKQTATALAKVNTSLDQVDGVLKDTRAAAASLSALLAESQSLLKDVKQTSTKIPDTVNAVNQTLETLPGLSMQTQEMMRQIQRLVEGAQRNWLINPYMQPDRASGGRIPPEDVATDRVRP